jgi:hypothetical protein
MADFRPPLRQKCLSQDRGIRGIYGIDWTLCEQAQLQMNHHVSGNKHNMFGGLGANRAPSLHVPLELDAEQILEFCSVAAEVL